jgi:hypothetical protein
VIGFVCAAQRSALKQGSQILARSEGRTVTRDHQEGSVPPRSYVAPHGTIIYYSTNVYVDIRVSELLARL